MHKAKDLLKLPKYRYIIVGGGVYLLELLIIWLLVRCGTSSLMAVTVSYWIGIISSFLLQKIITFGDRRMHHRIVVPQAIAFGLLVLFNFGFTLLMVKILSDVMPAGFARTLALGITVVWNFYLYKTRIFKRSDV